MNKRISDLKKETDELGLVVTPAGKKISRKDYIRELQKHYSQFYPEYEGSPMQKMVELGGPMLCKQYKNLKQEKKNEIWESDEWILEEKLDGNRAIIIIINGRYGVFSRNISVQNYLPVELTGKIEINKNFDLGELEDIIIDCELIALEGAEKSDVIVADTQLQVVSSLLNMDVEKSVDTQNRMKKEKWYRDRFYDEPISIITPVAFDIIDDRPYSERAMELSRFLEGRVFKAFQLFVFDTARTNVISALTKEDFLSEILASGGEGVIAKRKDSLYEHGKRGWIKIKRTVGGLGDTIDAFITGFERGNKGTAWENMVGSFVFSSIVVREDGSTYEHVIAKISGIPDEIRRDATIYNPDTDTVELEEEFMGQVCEIDGQCFSSRERRLRHAVILRGRPDKLVDDCTIEEATIDNNIL